MSGIGAFWLYPVIVAAGLLQAMGPPMNGALPGRASPSPAERSATRLASGRQAG